MKNPIQPLSSDKGGTLRFKSNAIVQHLLDTHPNCNLANLACMEFTNDDRQQFAQLIGYSLSGYGELGRYVDKHAYDTACAMADTPTMTEKARIAALEAEVAGLRKAAVAAMRNWRRGYRPVP